MMAQKLIELFGLDDYFFTVTKHNEYNTTGKTELHNIDSVEPIITGELNIIIAVLKYKLETVFYY